MEKKIFKESQSKALKITVLIFGAIFLLMFAPLASNGFKNVQLLLIVFGILLVAFLISIAAVAGQRRRKLVCTAEECEINSTNLWGSNSFEKSFRWRDVTDTNIVERFQHVHKGVISQYFLEADVGGETVSLWNIKMSSEKDARKLLNYVNRATPHLKYVWEKNADFGSRQVIVDADKYSKVARE